MLYKFFLKLRGIIRNLQWRVMFKFESHIGSTIGPYSIARFGKNASFSVNGILHARDSFKVNNEGTIKINGNVFFNSCVSLNCLGLIKIGDGCLFGEGVKIYDHDHEFGTDTELFKSGFVIQAVEIGNNVWVGSNVIILKGVSIGDNVVIGAGSIVTKNIEADTIFLCKTTPALIKF